MTKQQSELLDLITKEFRAYRTIPVGELQHKHDKKQFINGLMTAARVIGINYDELNAIFESMPAMEFKKDDFITPAYIREKYGCLKRYGIS